MLYGGTAPTVSRGTDGGYLVTIDTHTGVFSYVGATAAVSSGASLTGLAFVDGGMLTFTPARDANGIAVIGVTVQDDGGTENGGVDTSVAETFTIIVRPVNDPPIANADVATTLENMPLSFAASALAANDIAGPPNEIDQTLTVSRKASLLAQIIHGRPIWAL